MKTKSLICTFLLLVALQSCKTINETSKIVGTWQLTTFHYGDNNQQTMPGNVHRIKLITMIHFTWVQFMTENKQVESSAGGTFKVDGKNYTESIDWAGSSMTSYLCKEQKFQIKIENDKMYLAGQLSDGERIEEVWIKLK